MADVKRCDRCGEVYDPTTGDDENAVITFRARKAGLYRVGHDIDVCPDCFKKFSDWIYAKEE